MCVYTKNMLIRDIWKKVNASCVLVLPLYNKSINKFTHTAQNLPYMFQQICFDFGLQNTYLYNDINRCDKPTHLHLVFDSQALSAPLKSNLKEHGVNSKYYSLSEAIIDCDYFEDCFMYNGVTVFSLRIPEEFKEDIILITESKYSKVSSKYKEYISPIVGRVFKRSSELGYFLVKKTIATKVVKQSKVLKDELSLLLNTEIDKSFEYYEEFKPDKERVDFNKLIKLFETEKYVY